MKTAAFLLFALGLCVATLSATCASEPASPLPDASASALDCSCRDASPREPREPIHDDLPACGSIPEWDCCSPSGEESLPTCRCSYTCAEDDKTTELGQWLPFYRYRPNSDGGPA